MRVAFFEVSWFCVSTTQTLLKLGTLLRPFIASCGSQALLP